MEAAGLTFSAMKDFDWKVSFVMGSNKLAAMKNALIMVQINVDGENKPIALEMEKQETKLLLKSLEEAQAGLLAFCKAETALI